MKIIATSNFNDEMVPDKLVIAGLGEDEAENKVEEYNSLVKEHSTYFYKVVPDTYELHIFKP